MGDLKWNQYGVNSPFTRLYFMIAESGWLDFESGRIDLIPGKVCVVPSNTKVDLRTDKKLEKIYFHITCEFAGRDILENINKPYAMTFLAEDLDRLTSAFRDSSPSGIIRIRGIILETLSRFFEDCIPEVSRNFSTALEYSDLFSYIDSNLSAKLSGVAICEHFGYIYETFRHRFKRDNKISLQQYIINRIIQRGATLLLLTDKTVQEIADDLGFQDEFYFSRLFRKKMEYSPREYRRVNALLR